MNIITRKKEITEVIKKLNEATKLANDALAGLEELESSIENQKMFNQGTIVVDGVEYVKTDKEVKVGDYIVFEKDIMSMTKASTPYPIVGDGIYQTKDDNGINCEFYLSSWAEKFKVSYATFIKKSLTRKEIVNKAIDYIHTNTEDGYYFTTDERCCKAYFTHNREKRTSTLVLKGYFSGTIRHKETIKCHPDDAYNETIGKAILIARANKDEEMKELFENAPQPTEIEEGMVIDIMDCSGDIYERNFTVEYHSKQKDFIRGWQNSRVISNIKSNGFIIKDDTDVVY